MKYVTAAFAAALGLVGFTGAAGAVPSIATIKEYAVGIAEGYETTRLLSVGDRLPETSNPTLEFQMVGIPDGLGAHRAPFGKRIVYMNHELSSSVVSEPTIGQPLNRGAFVSKLVLDRHGNVISGERAYDWVYDENTFVGPAAAADNATRAFSRFCSGSLAGPEVGFDRYIYLTNEEEQNEANTFDGKGGLAVAIWNNTLYTLPKMGRYSWENLLVQPNRGSRTVVMGMEDGPAALAANVENSQMWMYVGKKDRRPGQTVLGRNGLDNGRLYVLVAVDTAVQSEADFQNGTFAVRWVEIENAESLTATQLEAAADTVGALRFARPEDGAFNDQNRHEFVFVTTGGAPGVNTLGRVYSLKIHPGNPTLGGTLEVVVNADQVVAAGGDTALSPDNIDISDDYLMINEDGTGESRPVMATKGRDGSIWRFDVDDDGIDPDSAVRVAELDPPGRDGVAVGPGVWETSGIIDVEGLWGEGEAWLFDVQAHRPTTAPAPNTVEDGQLLLMARADDHEDDHRGRDDHDD